eukprot:GHVR01103494.1.p1 GENE.GHVR01103494.1~~GHVR01103494.1.p1  ORF type:complete len:550 (+),score=76.83 GHVR01103494.1:600-2249(+)
MPSRLRLTPQPGFPFDKVGDSIASMIGTLSGTGPAEKKKKLIDLKIKMNEAKLKDIEDKKDQQTTTAFTNVLKLKSSSARTAGLNVILGSKGVDAKDPNVISMVKAITSLDESETASLTANLNKLGIPLNKVGALMKNDPEKLMSLIAESAKGEVKRARVKSTTNEDVGGSSVGDAKETVQGVTQAPVGDVPKTQLEKFQNQAAAALKEGDTETADFFQKRVDALKKRTVEGVERTRKAGIESKELALKTKKDTRETAVEADRKSLAVIKKDREGIDRDIAKVKLAALKKDPSLGFRADRFESALDKKRATTQAEFEGGIQEAAASAEGRRRIADTYREASKGFQTGTFSGVRSAAAHFLESVGLSGTATQKLTGDATSADITQTVEADMKRATRKMEKDSRLNKEEGKIIRDSVINFIKTPEGNLVLADVMTKIADRDEELLDIQARYLEENQGRHTSITKGGLTLQQTINKHKRANPVLDENLRKRISGVNRDGHIPKDVMRSYPGSTFVGRTPPTGKPIKDADGLPLPPFTRIFRTPTGRRFIIND